MRPDPVTVSISGMDIVVSPLTLSKVRRLEKILQQKVEPEMQMDRTVQIISIGLEGNPAVPSVDDMLISFQELDTLAGAILRMGGFLREETAAAGKE